MTILHSIFRRHWFMGCEFETYSIFLKVSLNLANVDNVYFFSIVNILFLVLICFQRNIYLL